MKLTSWRISLLIGAFLLLLAATLEAQPPAITKFTNGSASAVIPLDIDNNIIRMKMRINGSRQLTMIFDTGAGITGIDEHFLKELGLRPSSETLKGSGIGGTFSGKYVRSSTLSVEGAEVEGQPLAVFKINTPPGFDFDGIIGYDFIKAFVVEIDYLNKTLTLHDRKTYIYRGQGETLPLDLRGRKTPLITATFKVKGRSPFVTTLEVDTGFDGAFQLNSPVVKRQKLLRAFGDGKKGVSHGAGGDQQEATAQLANVKFGRTVINGPLVSLASPETTGAGASTKYGGLIGGEVLRRFKVILDYSRKRMILEPNKAFDEPYQDNSGL